MDLLGQDLAGTWGADLTIENDTLSAVLAQKIGEMAEEAAKNAGCEAGVSGNAQQTKGRVIKSVIVITKIEGEEVKYEASMSVENDAAGDVTDPETLELSVNGSNVTIDGDVEFVRIEMKGNMVDSDNFEGTFIIKMLDEYATLFEISPNAQMSGSFKAFRLEE